MLKPFIIPKERLIKISEDMEAEFKIGLENATLARTSIAMLPSFVPELPDGSGTFGTN